MMYLAPETPEATAQHGSNLVSRSFRLLLIPIVDQAADIKVHYTLTFVHRSCSIHVVWSQTGGRIRLLPPSHLLLFLPLFTSPSSPTSSVVPHPRSPNSSLLIDTFPWLDSNAKFEALERDICITSRHSVQGFFFFFFASTPLGISLPLVYSGFQSPNSRFRVTSRLIFATSRSRSLSSLMVKKDSDHSSYI